MRLMYYHTNTFTGGIYLKRYAFIQIGINLYFAVCYLDNRWFAGEEILCYISNIY
jgi:hypothetical protein